MNGQNGYNNNFFDLISLISLIVGVSNLQENREQSAHNDVQRENDRQAHYLLTEIARLFEGINQRLAQQDETLEKIARALKEMRGENNEHRQEQRD